jgi:hypothetical protein
MGIATFPSTTSPIKSIQRGAAVSAGNISITAVVVAKTIVNSFSTASSGTVAATGTLSGASGSTSGMSTSGSSGSVSLSGALFTGQTSVGTNAQWWTGYSPPFYTGRYGQFYNPNNVPGVSVPGSFSGSVNLNALNTNGMNVSLNATNLSGGSTNLVAGVNGAYLVDSTTIYATGPCRYEVIEYF